MIAVFLVNSGVSRDGMSVILLHPVDRSSCLVMSCKPKALAASYMLTGVSPAQASFPSVGSL